MSRFALGLALLMGALATTLSCSITLGPEILEALKTLPVDYPMEEITGLVVFLAVTVVLFVMAKYKPEQVE